MTSMFFYGTLRHLPLLHLVLGHPCDGLILSPAVLDGHAVHWASEQSFPLLVEAPGHAAEGILVAGLSAADVDRLNFYEGGFGYGLRTVEVDSDKGRQQTQVYFPTPGAWPLGPPWSLADWQARYAPMVLRAAVEAMGYFGQLSAEEFAAKYPMICTRAAAWVAAQSSPPVVQRSAMDASAIRTTGIATNHAGYFLMQTHRLRYPTFAGPLSPPLLREVFVAGDAAIVLPYDPLRDRVLLVEQFRMGPHGRGDSHPWLLEPVAGRVDGGESPEMAARRESIEETEVILTDLEPIASYYPSPGYSTEYFYTYLGLCDLPDGSAAIGGNDSEHEDIRTHVLDFDAAMGLIATGEANNGPLILSLLWLQRERPRLRAQARASA